MPDSYETGVPPLPVVDVALSRLFELDPTRDAIVHYRTNRHLLKAGAFGWWGGIVMGAQSNDVTVSNVFTSEQPGLSLHDIVQDRYLQDMSPELAQKWRRAVGYDDGEPLEEWQICLWLRSAWMAALNAYDSEPASLAEPGYRGGLFLHPRLPTLPTQSLLGELYRDRAWSDFILLTARHELSWFYLKVKMWHEAAGKLSDLSDASLGICLTADELEKLSMRTHGYYYYALRPTDSMAADSPDLPPVERRDAPRQAFSAASDVARLYYLLTRWYLKTYEQTVRAPQCEWEKDGQKCQRLKPKYAGRGPRPRYCPSHVKLSANQSKRKHARDVYRPTPRPRK